MPLAHKHTRQGGKDPLHTDYTYTRTLTHTQTLKQHSKIQTKILTKLSVHAQTYTQPQTYNTKSINPHTHTLINTSLRV